MKNNLLIVSNTSRNNLILAQELQKICINLKISNEIINLEEYQIPLYTPIQQKKKIPIEINLLSKLFIKAQGFIICAPEYNGSIPPNLTNLIAWISVCNKDWRLAFNYKTALIATHSGGGGYNLIQSLRIQLNHIGTLVIPRTITVNNTIKFDKESSTEKILELIKFLKY